MKLRRAAEKELSVELPVTEFRGQRLIVRLPHGNDFLDGCAKIGVNLGFVVAVDAPAHESRTSPDEAAILLAPSDDFEIAPREFASGFAGFFFMVDYVLFLALRRSSSASRTSLLLQ